GRGAPARPPRRGVPHVSAVRPLGLPQLQYAVHPLSEPRLPRCPRPMTSRTGASPLPVHIPVGYHYLMTTPGGIASMTRSLIALTACIALAAPATAKEVLIKWHGQ